jgi:hypothetical protein
MTVLKKQKSGKLHRKRNNLIFRQLIFLSSERKEIFIPPA